MLSIMVHCKPIKFFHDSTRKHRGGFKQFQKKLQLEQKKIVNLNKGRPLIPYKSLTSSPKQHINFTSFIDFSNPNSTSLIRYINGMDIEEGGVRIPVRATFNRDSSKDYLE